MSDHLKKELNIERMPGQSPLDAVLKDRKQRVNWSKLADTEMLLIRFILDEMFAIRAAGITPLFHIFEFGERGWEIKRQVSGTDWRKYKAWWELIYEVQRDPRDQASVKLAYGYVVQENLKRHHSKILPVNCADLGVPDVLHAEKVKIAVKHRIEHLLPNPVKLESNASAVIAPKYISHH